MIYIKLTVSEKKYTSNGGLTWAIEYYLFNTKNYRKSELSCKIYPTSSDVDGCLLVFPDNMEEKMLYILYENSTECKLLKSLGYNIEDSKCEISKDPSDFYNWLEIPEEIIDVTDILKRLIIIENKLNFST